MSGKPMFFFAAAYDDLADAEADYDAVKALHAGDFIGSYDAAIITKREGKVTVHKTELPIRHGAWVGLAAGAAVAIVAPVAMPVLVASGGAGLGAWIGHLAHGTSRAEMREIGEMLDDGQAALIVIGVDRDAERVQRTAGKAMKSMTKRIEGDHEEAEREALETMAHA